MNIDIKQLRNFRLQYEDNKNELGETCAKIIEYAKFMGCQQKEGKEDVRVSLAFMDGFISAIEIMRSGK